MSLDEDGVASFFKPNGDLIPAVIRPPSFRGNSEVSMAQLCRDAGLTIDARTNMPQLDDEPPQYDWITSVMTRSDRTPPR